MSLAERFKAWARQPPVVMVLLGLALYPFVREEKAVRTLRLSTAQAERAYARERTRSDAAETSESRRRAREEALDEEALAELAIAEELHRKDDGLRLALAQAARHELEARVPPPTPTDAELHALAAEVSVESQVDAEVRRAGGASERSEGVTLAALEDRYGVRHLPMPTDAPVEASVTTVRGEAITLVLRAHVESAEERFERLRPELERRFARQNLDARVRAAVRDLRAAYDRTEAP